MMNQGNPRKPKETQESLQSGIVYALAGLAIEFLLKIIGAPRAPK
jgi:hypothetical protein